MVTNDVIGLAMVCVGVQFSVMANTVMKNITDVPMLQLMQARFLLQWMTSTSLCLTLRAMGWKIHLTGRPGCRWLLAAQACSASTALGSFWGALRILPVGEATAITYLNPVVCGLLATQLLGEQLGWRFSVQAIASCLGVLLVVNPVGATSSALPAAPGTPSSDFGVGLALLGCMFFATGNCLVRLLRAVHPLEVQVYQDTLAAWVFLPTAQLVTGAGTDFSAWDTHKAGLLVLFTVFGLGASFFVIMGYSMAPASKVALFTYLEVPSSFASQVLLFGQVPSAVQLLGAAILVGAAACRLLHEVQEAAQMRALDDEDGLHDDLPPSRQISASLVPPLPSTASPLMLATADPVDLLEPLSFNAAATCPIDELVEPEPASSAAEAGSLKQPLLQA